MKAQNKTQKFNMIEQQIRPWDVLNISVLEAMHLFPREEFVPLDYRSLAYADCFVPLSNSQFMLEPKIEGRLLEVLLRYELNRVLHVGTGSGYFATLLSHFSRQVTTVDLREQFIENAEKLHKKFAIKNITYLCQNAFYGLREPNQFDCIVFTAAHEKEPPSLREQLSIGGVLIIFEGSEILQNVKIIQRLDQTEFETKYLFETKIPFLEESWRPEGFHF